MITFQKIIDSLFLYAFSKGYTDLQFFLEIIQQAQFFCTLKQWKAIQCDYLPIAQFIFYACIFIFGTWIAFKKRLWTKDVKVENLRQIQSKDAID